MPPPPTLRPRDALSPGGSRPPPPRMVPNRNASMSPVRTVSSMGLNASPSFVVKSQSLVNSDMPLGKSQSIIVKRPVDPPQRAPSFASPRPSQVPEQPSSLEAAQPLPIADTTVEAMFECRDASFLLYDILRHDEDAKNRQAFDRALKEGIFSHLRYVAGLQNLRESDIWTEVRPGIISRLMLSHPGSGGMPTVTDGHWPLRFRVVVTTVPRDEEMTRRRVLGMPSTVFEKALALYEIWFGRSVLGAPVSLIELSSSASLVNGMQPIALPIASPQARKTFILRQDHSTAWSTSVEAPRQISPQRSDFAGVRPQQRQPRIVVPDTVPIYESPRAVAESPPRTLDQQTNREPYVLEAPRQIHHPREQSLESVEHVHTTTEDSAPTKVSLPIADFGTRAVDPQVRNDADESADPQRRVPARLPPKRFSSDHIVQPSKLVGGVSAVMDGVEYIMGGPTLGCSAADGVSIADTSPEGEQMGHRALRGYYQNDGGAEGDKRLEDDIHWHHHHHANSRHGKPKKREGSDRWNETVAYRERYRESPVRAHASRQSSRTKGHGHSDNSKYLQRYQDPDPRFALDLRRADDWNENASEYSDDFDAPIKRRHHHHSAQLSTSSSSKERRVRNHDDARPRLYTNQDCSEFFVRVRSMSPPTRERNHHAVDGGIAQQHADEPRSRRRHRH